MREFVKGWRRKVGCITLVMALAVVGEWLRSYVFLDEISFKMFETPCYIDSERGRLAFIRSSLQSTSAIAWFSVKLEGVDRDPTWLSLYSNPATTDWRWECGGVLFCESTNTQSRVWAIPYWSFVSPLTLLSAYLILSPGKRVTTSTCGERGAR